MNFDPWGVHCQRIVALLLAGNVQAGVVALSGGGSGIRVYNESRNTRIIWGINDQMPGHWGWTMVRPDGLTEAYTTPLEEGASPEEVAATIATAFELSEMEPE